MTKNTITSISIHRKIQLEDSDIHLLKKQLFDPIFYLVTTPSTCCMVNAGQPHWILLIIPRMYLYN